MLNCVSSVPDIFNTAICPIAKQVTMDVLCRLGLDVYFDGNIDYHMGGTAVSKSEDDNKEINLQQHRADVNVKYSFAASEQKWEVNKSIDETQQTLTHLHNSNLKVLFHEPLDDITIIEYEKPLTISCTCIMMFNDIVAAIDAIQRLQTAYSTGIMQHDLTHTYFLPEGIYLRLYQLYKFAGYDTKNFFAYMEKFSGARIIKVVNRHDNTDKALSVRRNRSGIVSNMDFQQGEPVPVGSEKSPNMFSVTFTLNTQLSMPNFIGISYPVVIQNSLVTEELIPIKKNEMYSPATINHPFFSIDHYLRLTASQETIPNDPIHIPWYDDWSPNSKYLINKYKPFLISVFTIDNIEDDDSTTIIDLENGLGDVSLIQPIIDILKEQKNLSLSFMSKVNVAVYRNNIMVEPKLLSLDDGVTLVIPNRGKNGVYRLVLSSTDVIYTSASQLRTFDTTIRVSK